MKKASILIFLPSLSYSLFSQSFRIPQNVVSTSLYQPFAPLSGYTISFERLIDPGYSLNAAQFSYKLNTTLISYNQKKRVCNNWFASFLWQRSLQVFWLYYFTRIKILLYLGCSFRSLCKCIWKLYWLFWNLFRY